MELNFKHRGITYILPLTSQITLIEDSDRKLIYKFIDALSSSIDRNRPEDKLNSDHIEFLNSTANIGAVDAILNQENAVIIITDPVRVLRNDNVRHALQHPGTNTFVVLGTYTYGICRDNTTLRPSYNKRDKLLSFS